MEETGYQLPLPLFGDYVPLNEQEWVIMRKIREKQLKRMWKEVEWRKALLMGDQEW
jgi:hypothetical protein